MSVNRNATVPVGLTPIDTGSRAAHPAPSAIDLPTDAFGDLPRRATWSWLGVTMYLPTDAVARTLRPKAACGTGTTLVVNFLLTADEQDDAGQEVAAGTADLVSAVGEPVVTTCGRRAVRDVLRSSCFRTIEMLDWRALEARYVGDRADLCFPGTTIIAIASA